MHGLSVLPFVYQKTNGFSQFYEVQTMRMDISVQQIFHCELIIKCNTKIEVLGTVAL